MDMPEDEDFVKKFKKIRSDLWQRDSEVDHALTVYAPGCAIVDSGATAGVISFSAADDIQQQRLRQGEPHEPTVSESTKTFRLGDGHAEKASVTIRQRVIIG